MNTINASACFCQHLPSRGMTHATLPPPRTQAPFPGPENRLSKPGAGRTNGPSPLLLREYRPVSIKPLWRLTPPLRLRQAAPAIRHGNNRRLRQHLLAAMAGKDRLSTRKTVCCETSRLSINGRGNGSAHRFGGSNQDSNSSLRELLREIDDSSRQTTA